MVKPIGVGLSFIGVDAILGDSCENICTVSGK